MARAEAQIAVEPTVQAAGEIQVEQSKAQAREARTPGASTAQTPDGIQVAGTETQVGKAQPEPSSRNRATKEPVVPQTARAVAEGASFPTRWENRYYHPARPASAYQIQTRDEDPKAGSPAVDGVQVVQRKPTPDTTPSGGAGDGEIQVESVPGAKSVARPAGQEPMPEKGYTFLWWKPGKEPAEKPSHIEPAAAPASLKLVNGRIIRIRPDGLLEVDLDGEKSTKLFCTSNTAVPAVFEANWNAVRRAETDK